MAGVKGRSGRGQEKPFRDALRLAIEESEGDAKKLRRVAEALVREAMGGNIQAIGIIADRLDGKPKQETDITVNDRRDPNSIPDAELAAIVAEDGGGDASSASENSGIVH